MPFEDEFSDFDTDSMESSLDPASIMEHIEQAIGAPANSTSPEKGRRGIAMGASIASALSSSKSMEELDSTLEGQELELIQKANRNEDLNREEAIALGFISVLPILVGALAKGKKGIGIGAQAGGLGGMTFLKGREAEQDRDRLSAAAELKQVRATRDKIDRVALGDRSRELNAESSFQLSKRKKDAGITGQTAGAINALAKAQKANVDLQRSELALLKDQNDAELYSQTVVVEGLPFLPGSATTRQREFVQDTAPYYRALQDDISKMIPIIKQKFAPGRLVGEEADELKNLRETAKSNLQHIRTAGGKALSTEAKRIEKIVGSSNLFMQSMQEGGALIGGSTAEQRINNLKELVDRDFKNFLTFRNHTPATYAIGEKIRSTKNPDTIGTVTGYSYEYGEYKPVIDWSN